MADWAAHARDAMGQGPTALVTILATEGSAPRGSGARMVVTAADVRGTIGGGALEHQAIAQARAILDLAPGSWRIQDYPLGPLLGQCCGGRVRLLVEHLGPETTAWLEAPHPTLTRLTMERVVRSRDVPDGTPRLVARGDRPDVFVEPVECERRQVLLFGAGHVGRALAERAEGLPFRIAWYDCRPEAAERPGVVLADCDVMVACAGAAEPDALVAIMTHDHGLDYRLAAAALAGRADFVGLIGSATKRARFLSKLAQDGIDAARLRCPIGLPGVTGKEPEAIAISVLAQLLSLRGDH
jgi:xanthine dehydrogenase accessory factor